MLWGKTVTERHPIWLAVLLVAVLAACTRGVPVSTPPGSPGLVDVGGRQLYLTCLGEGSPTVVLEAGGTGNSTNWSPVQPGIAEFTRVCAYDRAGEGYSNSVPAHQSMEAMVHDLHALLDAGGIEGPYVIVGHSFGGRLVRPFATLYPSDVVGMVLVDPGHEAFLARAQEALTHDEWEQYVEASGGGVLRMQEMQGTADTGPPGKFPLVVLSASGYIDHPGLSNDVDEKLHQVLVELHKELVALSPNGPHIMAEGSGHGIQNDRPDIVLAAIRQVVNLARTRYGLPQ